MKTLEERIAEAEARGMQAHAEGIKAASALDAKFIDAFVRGARSADILPLLKAWSRGWHTANAKTEIVL
jgi:hypothetical protein